MDVDTTGFGPLGSPPRRGVSTLHRLRPTAVAIAFWGSVGLPAAYLWMMAGGIETLSELSLLLGLLALHGVAIVGGRNYPVSHGPES